MTHTARLSDVTALGDPALSGGPGVGLASGDTGCVPLARTDRLCPASRLQEPRLQEPLLQEPLLQEPQPSAPPRSSILPPAGSDSGAQDGGGGHASAPPHPRTPGSSGGFWLADSRDWGLAPLPPTVGSGHDLWLTSQSCAEPLRPGRGRGARPAAHFTFGLLAHPPSLHLAPVSASHA